MKHLSSELKEGTMAKIDALSPKTAFTFKLAKACGLMNEAWKFSGMTRDSYLEQAAIHAVNVGLMKPDELEGNKNPITLFIFDDFMHKGEYGKEHFEKAWEYHKKKKK